jgi:CelD/BcsL family acetyltransferase involved in cellulose biosynthesis
MSLRREIIYGHEAMQTIEPAVRDLYARATRPNPYQCPGWVYGWLETLGETEEPLAILLWEGDQLKAFWPFFECYGLGGKGLWPLGAHCADLFDPLVEDLSQSLPTELIDGLEALLQKYRFTWLPLMAKKRATEEFSEVFKSRKFRHLIRPRTENQKIHIPEDRDFETFYKAHIGTKSRQNLRRKWRRLEEQGELSYGVITGEEAVRDFLIIMIAIERKSWKGQQKLGIFSRKDIKEFYNVAIPKMAADGELRIDTLSIGERVIAYEFSLIRDGYRCVHNQAYLPEFRDWSPGTQLMLHTLEWAFNSGIEMVDFMQGKHDYKLRFATESTLLYDVNLFAKGFKGWINYAAVKLVAKSVKNSYTAGEEG